MDYINVVCNIITPSSFVPTNVLYCSMLILIRLIHINSLEARLHMYICMYCIRAYMYVCMCVFMHAYARAQTNLDIQCSNIH